MRPTIPFLLACLATGCALQQSATTAMSDPRLAAAEALVDAFYSFDPVRLRSAMAHAPESAPVLLYYQGWAEGGNYRVLDRKPCRFDKPDEATCAITVKDDLIAALGTGFDVTDVFTVSFKDGRIVGVRTSSNDPPEFEQALKWVDAQQPALFDGECKGFFRGGPTPKQCVRAVVRGFADFAARKRSGG